MLSSSLVAETATDCVIWAMLCKSVTLIFLKGKYDPITPCLKSSKSPSFRIKSKLLTWPTYKTFHNLVFAHPFSHLPLSFHSSLQRCLSISSPWAIPGYRLWSLGLCICFLLCCIIPPCQVCSVFTSQHSSSNIKSVCLQVSTLSEETRTGSLLPSCASPTPGSVPRILESFDKHSFTCWMNEWMK